MARTESRETLEDELRKLIEQEAEATKHARLRQKQKSENGERVVVRMRDGTRQKTEARRMKLAIRRREMLIRGKRRRARRREQGRE